MKLPPYDNLLRTEAAMIVARLCGVSRDDVAESFLMEVRGVAAIERRYCTEAGELRAGARELLSIPSALGNRIF